MSTGVPVCVWVTGLNISLYRRVWTSRDNVSIIYDSQIISIIGTNRSEPDELFLKFVIYKSIHRTPKRFRNLVFFERRNTFFESILKLVNLFSSWKIFTRKQACESPDELTLSLSVVVFCDSKKCHIVHRPLKPFQINSRKLSEYYRSSRFFLTPKPFNTNHTIILLFHSPLSNFWNWRFVDYQHTKIFSRCIQFVLT
jgi:hypothetical protein